MEKIEIIQKINSFPRWHYQFNLKGNLTPIFDQGHTNRHLQRKRYFFDPLVKLLGGSLEGKNVLDLGCNAGFWSLCAINEGCDFVLGIDGRKMHIDQANFVFEVNNIDKSRFKFVVGNIFSYDFQRIKSFDIVLCLGLLYHISKPIFLMEKIAQANSDILIIDTQVSRVPGSYMEIIYDNLDEPRSAVDYSLVMHPTKQAVFDMVRQFGYSIAMLKPQFKSYAGSIDYQTGWRRAFLCTKKTNLSNLPMKVESINLSTLSGDTISWIARKLLFRRFKLTKK